MFDEIIDTLDSNLQSKVLELLEEKKNNHTILIISREQTILQKADKIIRFDNNKVKRNLKTIK